MAEIEYDVFVSHAREDKESFVNPLVQRLRANGLTVWYDDFSLEVGDSLRQSIERGLSRSRFGVVVISPEFLAKQWPQQELNGLTALESADGKKRVLPIWMDVSQADVAAASPMLADRVALDSGLGHTEVAERLTSVIRPDNPEEYLYAAKYENKVIDIVALARSEGGVISNHWFRECKLFGPAVFAFGDGNVLVELQIPVEMFFTLLPRPYIGMILIQYSRFERVEFENIGFAGSPEVIEQTMLHMASPPREGGPQTST